MATEIHWLFITDKYSLVDHLDRAIVVARFNQNELLRDLIELRAKFLESKTYEALNSNSDALNAIFENAVDKRLTEVLSSLIDQLSSYKDGHFDLEKNIEEVETKVSD